MLVIWSIFFFKIVSVAPFSRPNVTLAAGFAYDQSGNRAAIVVNDNIVDEVRRHFEIRIQDRFEQCGRRTIASQRQVRTHLKSALTQPVALAHTRS